MDRREPQIPLSRFGALVAQLDSIVASAPLQHPDALLCFDLLSELTTTVEEEPRESILKWQRKCEDVLHALLVLGARRPVRRLASVAMVRVIAKGDGISVYSRVSSFQGWLADGKKSEPTACAGMAHCLGEIYRNFGRRITSGLLETIHLAVKLMKFYEDFVRKDALEMLEKALDGSDGNGSSAAYSEAFRLITRVAVSDRSCLVRLAAARCLKTFASIGGPGLGVTELEVSISCCLKALEDPNTSVRDGFSEALGALLALAIYPEARVKQKWKGQPASSKKLNDALQKHLISPFSKASGVHMKELRIGLTLSFVFYLQVLRLKYHLPDNELHNFALQCMDMLRGNADSDAHALACVLYILRIGIADQMTESAQRSFLVLLARQLDTADYQPSMGVAVLRTLSYLLTTLGEVPIEFKDVIDNTVVAALSHSSVHVRIEAALTLRSLAEVDPTCVGGLISYGVTTLHALRESAVFEKGNQLNIALDSLHGQAAVLASLVSISPKLLLGYPSRLPKSIFEVSKQMLTEFSRNPLAASIEKEAGWSLLASLLASLPKEDLEDQVFDVLMLWAGPFVGNPEFHLWRTQDWASEIRVLSIAIETLTAFIRSFVSQSVIAFNGGVLLQPVLTYLNGALSYISILSSKQVPNMKSSLNTFIIRTLMAFQSLPNPMLYKSEHSHIMQICSSPFSEPSQCEESSCLRFLLDKRDAHLGPWIPGRDWFEDELRSFDGNKDGVVPCAWDDQLSTFPLPESLSKMLINKMLLCFGTIFAFQDNDEKLALLNMIDSCLKVGKKQSWHAANITNACVGLLCGLKVALASGPQIWDVNVLNSMQLIFQGILAEGEICPSQRRASAEALGLLARLGNDIFTAKMTRTLLGELGTTADPCYVASAAFSLGCIHRSAGGMALSALVPSSVAFFSNLAKNSNARLQIWYLHALLLTIESAGLSYISQVQGTLFLVIEILLSDESGSVDLRQEIGRLINAVVAVMGPELAPGSTFFSRCKSIVSEISSCQEVSALLESVRFTQQLVLFAPQAVSVHSHIKNLLPTLSSRQPSLRYLAVSTLGHLMEKDSVSIAAEKIEENLFNMLDEETDTEIGNLIRSTITRLLHISCPLCPSRWLSILHNMVLSSKGNSKENLYNSEKDNTNGASQGDSGMYYGDDDTDMISSSGEEHVQGSLGVSTLNSRRDKHLRYRTRLFAAECLTCIPEAVGANVTHFDLSLARRQQQKARGDSNDWLVLHLQEILSISYQISTGQVEGMQPIGVRLLCTIMDKFKMTEDPDLPGHLLLEQYQAQLVSAVRSAVGMSANPLLFEAGLQLATKILTSRILKGDCVAITRLFSLISQPLDDIKNLYYPSFAEWIACKIKATLLVAHASIKCFLYSMLREPNGLPDDYMSLIPLFSSNSGILGKYWVSMLKDYVCISLDLHSFVRNESLFEGIQSSPVSSTVKGYLDKAWILILQAVALDSVPINFEGEKGSKSNEMMPRKIFLTGQSMVKLELGDFHFLWGLALLLLFQGAQGQGNQSKGLFFIQDGKHNVAVGHKEKYMLTPLAVASVVFQCLSNEAYFDCKFLTVNLCKEVLQVLLYAYQLENAHQEIIHLLSQIVRLCPDSYFEVDDFTFATSELYFKCLFVELESRKILLIPDDGDGLLSKLSIIAKLMVIRRSHKNRWKFVLALISRCYKLYSGASSDIYISKTASFLGYIAPFMSEWFRDEAEHDNDDQAHFLIVCESWASTLLFFVKDCVWRIQDVHFKSSGLPKVVTKMLVCCLEEIASVAGLLHETFRFKKNKDIRLLSVVKICVQCFKDTFSCTNVQVATVGLHVLKIKIQRVLAGDKAVDKHSFLLFLSGELIGDVFVTIQNLWKEPISKIVLAVTEECLGLLFLFHKLSLGSNSHQAFTRLLLGAIVMLFSLCGEGHSKELLEVKTIARNVIFHLVQDPSSVAQVKDAMILMPVAYRQQLQDMIRSSVRQTASVNKEQMVLNLKPVSLPTMDKVNQEVEAIPYVDNKNGVKETGELSANSGFSHSDRDLGGFDDEDDAWNSFQSLPAESPSTSTNDTNNVAAALFTAHGDGLISKHPERNPFESTRDVGGQTVQSDIAKSLNDSNMIDRSEYTSDSDGNLPCTDTCSNDSVIRNQEIECGRGHRELKLSFVSEVEDPSLSEVRKEVPLESIDTRVSYSADPEHGGGLMPSDNNDQELKSGPDTVSGNTGFSVLESSPNDENLEEEINLEDGPQNLLESSVASISMTDDVGDSLTHRESCIVENVEILIPSASKNSREKNILLNLVDTSCHHHHHH